MTVLITGARKGIGRALAEHYLAKGHSVIGVSRGTSNLQSPNYRHFTADVSVQAEVGNLFRTLRTEHAVIDALVNNAGMASMNHFLLTPTSTMEKQFQLNVLGTMFVSQEAAKLMRKSPSPRIVNFSTVAVPLALEGEAVYVATKAAVESFTRVLAKELAHMNITVNAIGPTPIPTDLIASLPQEKIENLLKQQSIRRLGTVGDVINVVDFFLDPNSSFVTGQVLYLGGVS